MTDRTFIGHFDLPPGGVPLVERPPPVVTLDTRDRAILGLLVMMVAILALVAVTQEGIEAWRAAGATNPLAWLVLGAAWLAVPAASGWLLLRGYRLDLLHLQADGVVLERRRLFGFDLVRIDRRHWRDCAVRRGWAHVRDLSTRGYLVHIRCDEGYPDIPLFSSPLEFPSRVHQAGIAAHFNLPCVDSRGRRHAPGAALADTGRVSEQPVPEAFTLHRTETATRITCRDGALPWYWVASLTVVNLAFADLVLSALWRADLHAMMKLLFFLGYALVQFSLLWGWAAVLREAATRRSLEIDDTGAITLRRHLFGWSWPFATGRAGGIFRCEIQRHPLARGFRLAFMGLSAETWLAGDWNVRTADWLEAAVCRTLAPLGLSGRTFAAPSGQRLASRVRREHLVLGDENSRAVRTAFDPDDTGGGPARDRVASALTRLTEPRYKNYVVPGLVALLALILWLMLFVIP